MIFEQVSNCPDSYPPLGENPYWVFISFLYAWVAVKVAQRFSKVSTLQSSEQQWTAGSYLTLAAFVVGTSWVGWTMAIENCVAIRPTRVISTEALLTIVDFAILSVYFTFILMVGRGRASDGTPGPYPARQCSSYWLMVIMLLYLTWDFLVHLVIPYYTGRPHRSFWESSWMTVLCALIAGIAFIWLKRVRADRPFWIVAGDVSLIFLMLFYRALKEYPDPVYPKSLIAFMIAFAFFFLFFGVPAGIVGSRPPSPRLGRAVASRT